MSVYLVAAGLTSDQPNLLLAATAGTSLQMRTGATLLLACQRISLFSTPTVRFIRGLGWTSVDEQTVLHHTVVSLYRLG